MNRLKQKYNDEIIPSLTEKYKYTSKMSVPKLEKIVVNIGAGDASSNSKLLDAAMRDLEIITGQKPVKTVAKKAIAGFRDRIKIGRCGKQFPPGKPGQGGAHRDESYFPVRRGRHGVGCDIKRTYAELFYGLARVRVQPPIDKNLRGAISGERRDDSDGGRTDRYGNCPSNGLWDENSYRRQERGECPGYLTDHESGRI